MLLKSLPTLTATPMPMAEIPTEVRIVADLVDHRIQQLFNGERERWVAVDTRLGEAVDELERMANGGKRLRAAFCYYSWLGAGGQPSQQEQIVDAGAACELLQTFALIHDDIMDNAATRRGEQTIHHRQAQRIEGNGWRGEPRRYGEGVALLVGDLSHVYADQLIGASSVEARGLWDELRVELNMGQYLDMRSAASSEFDRETAQRVATFKSALYTIVRPLQLGAAYALPEPDSELHRKLEAFGRPVGQAFQLRDDLLGVLGDPGQVGKPVGDDLREGKVTELVAVALERADEYQRAELAGIGRADLTDGDCARIVAVLEDTGAIAEIEHHIDDLVATAAQATASLPYSQDVRETLDVLANYVAARTH